MIFAAIMIICSAATCYAGDNLENKSIAVMETSKGIGNIAIGDTLQDVVKKMRKKPSDGKTVKFGGKVEYWLDYQEHGITFIFAEDKTLSRIAVSNPGIVMKKGDVKVNSTVNDLLKHYGAGESRNLNDTYEQRSYKDKGVGFTINKNTEKIETITIQRAVP